MRIRAKKIGAIIISALLLTQLVPNVIWAESINETEKNIESTDDTDYEVSDYGVIHIRESGEATGKITVGPNGKLYVQNGGIASGKIVVASGGRVYIEGGGIVQGSIDVLINGKVIIEEGGTVSGTINLLNGDTPSLDSGGTVTIKSGGTASGIINIKYGEVNVDAGGQAHILNMSRDVSAGYAQCNNHGTIENVNVADGSYLTDGKTGTLYMDAVDNNSRSGVYMLSNSVTDIMTVSVTDTSRTVSPVLIDADEGARVNQTLNVCSDYLDSSSSGTILVGSTGAAASGGLLELNGNNAFPSGLKFEVASVDTRINNNMSSSAGVCSVVCEGKTYPLPVATSGTASLATIYGTSVSADKINLADLAAGYGTGDAEEEVLSVGLTGGTSAGRMNCRITHIPEFIELRNDSGTLLKEGSNVTLENADDFSENFTVRAKIGNAAAKYSDTLEFALETNIVNEPNNGISNIVIREVSIPISLSVARKTGSGKIVVEDVYYGEPIQPVVTSDTNGIANVRLEYKVKGADDSTYTTIQPTQLGTYTVRATFAETKEYTVATATDDFTISQMITLTPKHPYELRGTMGENSYYTSNVTIIPAEGYLIAETADGEYKKELTISQSSTGLMIYLQNIETGGITEGIAVTDFLIDQKAPVVSKAVSGQTIYSDEAEIIVKDENLAQVLVNGEAVEIKDNQAILKLASNGGEEKYEIVTTDIAGNQSKIQITVAAEWMKKMIIPSGVKVRLSQECAYTLGSGTWKVSGDGTEYSGGNTFYVRSDGEYSFTKTN